MQIIRALIKTMRPKQWTKNGFIFAALVFDRKLLTVPYLARTVAGFLLFCLISGVVYVINDLADVESDRLHPKKRLRPLAAGVLTPGAAWSAVAMLTALCLVAAVLLSPTFAMILVLYLAIQVAYSFSLKHHVILDVLTIAAGFVLRVGAGIPLVDAERFSPWLYICTTFLALFLGLGKRRGELILLGSEAAAHRPILKSYNLVLLDQLMGIVTSVTILGYALYTFSAPNLPGNRAMMLTIPFVIYGIFRYLYLIHVEGSTLAPDEVLLTDRPLQATLLLWGAVAVGILYYG
jgi:4-hydroxybenzoate polyprenyltransferase